MIIINITTTSKLGADHDSHPHAVGCCGREEPRDCVSSGIHPCAAGMEWRACVSVLGPPRKG